MIKRETAIKGDTRRRPLPDPPDIARPRTRLLAAALAAPVVVGLVTGFRDLHGLAVSLGDTDDATRLVLVRGLLNGQGWWDPKILRLQPPHGVVMHWSRLLDGGLAGFDWTLQRVFPAGLAETLTRLLWPLLWTAPIALAALLLSDALAADADGRRTAPSAPLVCLVFLVTTFSLYWQFRPGRIDHHDVQMTLYLLALAGACERRRPRAGGLLAGAASGLGLAVGLEALVFDALIGAGLAARFIADPKAAGRLFVYGLALAGTTLGAYLVQTPPPMWGKALCDALALNSALAVGAAGAGSAILARTLQARSARARAFGLALVGAAAAGLYVGLDPRCLKGPFADVDPAIKGFWLVHVREMRPWLLVLRLEPDDALIVGVPPIMGALAALFLARRARRRVDLAFLLSALLLSATAAAGFGGVRMAGYAEWTALPLIAAAGADAAETAARTFGRDRLIVVAFAALLLTPELSVFGAVEAREVVSRLRHKTPSAANAPREPPDRCSDTPSYRRLAALAPAGTVLSEIDLGPFILANTPHSALAAPYHRMSWGLVAARRALAAAADHGAEARVRALGVAYVVECRAHLRKSDREGLGPDSLQRRLDAGRPPAWLTPVGPMNEPLEILRVAPLAAPAGD